MDAHVKALGVIYIVLGIFTALGGLALFGILAGAGLIADDRVAALTTGLIGTVLGDFSSSSRFRTSSRGSGC